MVEFWKPIKGYEGFYEVSNYGNVRSLDRKIKHAGGTISLRKGRPVTASFKNGYLYVPLCKDAKLKFYQLHRIVAAAFIPNPQNYPCVNHKDEVKTNNIATNLEWCSYNHNNTWNGRHLKIAAKLSKAVAQCDRDMNIIAVFPSLSEAARSLGRPNDTHIGQCCRGLRRSACGYKWRYV